MSLELASMDTDTLRSKILEIAKRHKASWIELGQYLYTVYNDKMYKDWGFMSFETYCWNELRLKQTTAVKLLKSYYFLEKEEPKVLNESSSSDQNPKDIPNFESVNLLRLAKNNKKITPKDYKDIRESVLEKAREPKEVKAQVKQIAFEREEEQNPEEVRRTRRNASIRRLIGFLSSTKKEMEGESLLPDHILKQMETLAQKLEDQLE